MKRVKKPKKKSLPLTSKQINDIKWEGTLQAFKMVGILFLLAANDELKKHRRKGLNDDELVDIFKRALWYSEHIKEKRVDLKYAQNLVEQATGVTMKGWC